MPSSEHAYSTSYTFAPPQVQGEQAVVRHFVVHGGARFAVSQAELVEPLRAMGVRVEMERVVEPETRTCEGFAAEVEAFHRDLGLDLAGAVLVSARGFGIVETPSRLGQGEHRRRRALVERFLRDHGLSFTTECRVMLSEGACQPLSADLVAGAGVASA